MFEVLGVTFQSLEVSLAEMIIDLGHLNLRIINYFKLIVNMQNIRLPAAVQELVGTHEIKGHGPPTGAHRKRVFPKVYTAERIIGNGSFGVVYKAVQDERSTQIDEALENGEEQVDQKKKDQPQSNNYVAIKKVYQDKRYKNRELQILKILRHPFCIKMKHYFYTNGDAADEVYLNVVMEHVPDTLYKVMKSYMK